jgi:hypothetical protein
MDAISHFHPDRPDLSIDAFPIEHCFAEAAWIDVSDVPPRTHITLERVKRALDAAGVDALPAGGALLYYTGARWDDPLRFVSEYPGLDADASRWILDQGVTNVLTDAVSTDNPADVTYPNHTAHAERLVNHTEVVANIQRIGVHRDDRAAAARRRDRVARPRVRAVGTGERRALREACSPGCISSMSVPRIDRHGRNAPSRAPNFPLGEIRGATWKKCTLAAAGPATSPPSRS